MSWRAWWRGWIGGIDCWRGSRLHQGASVRDVVFGQYVVRYSVHDTALVVLQIRHQQLQR